MGTAVLTAETILKYNSPLRTYFNFPMEVPIMEDGTATITISDITGSPIDDVSFDIPVTSTMTIGELGMGISSALKNESVFGDNDYLIETGIYEVGGNPDFIISFIKPFDNVGSPVITISGITIMPPVKTFNLATSSTKIVDITDYPDLSSAPNMLDATTLTNAKRKTSKMSLQESADLTFGANYDKTSYGLIKDLRGFLETEPSFEKFYTFTLELGTAGADGIFKWYGEIDCIMNAGTVDEIRKMNLLFSTKVPVKFID